MTIERFLGYAESAVLILNNPMKQRYVMQPCARPTDLFVVLCPDPTLTSVMLLKSHTNGILLTWHNQGIAQWSPDPFPHERVGSGHETKSARACETMEPPFYALFKNKGCCDKRNLTFTHTSLPHDLPTNPLRGSLENEAPPLRISYSPEQTPIVHQSLPIIIIASKYLIPGGSLARQIQRGLLKLSALDLASETNLVAAG